jgi:hypothetical protein
MARGLSSAAIASVTSETPIRTVAIELDFPSGFVRINGSPADISLNGNIFLGVGGLGAITTVEESAELRAFDLSVQLSGVPRDSVAIALSQAYQGRRGSVWEVPLSPTTYQPVDAPILFFRGRMDQLDITVGDTATVSVRLQNRLADWDRPKLRRYTDEDQRRAHPGDLGLRFVAATVEKQLLWPAKGWWDNNPPPKR